MPSQFTNVRRFRQSPLRRAAAAAVDGFTERHPVRRAIARLRQTALGAKHDLSVFRPDAQRDGFLLASCRGCGAGASIHLETGVDSPSEQLAQACPVRAPQGGVIHV